MSLLLWYDRSVTLFVLWLLWLLRPVTKHSISQTSGRKEVSLSFLDIVVWIFTEERGCLSLRFEYANTKPGFYKHTFACALLCALNPTSVCSAVTTSTSLIRDVAVESFF